MLVRRLDEEDLAVLEIVEDPIFFSEFMRSTNFGSMKKEEWPKPFELRWYQKDLETDQTEKIVITGGRAIGKCSPIDARVYTYPYGYQSIRNLILQQRWHGHFIVYALDKEMNLVQRRARVVKNGLRDVYKVISASGHVFEGTANHPLQTKRGYVMIKDLQDDDEIAVVTSLPHDSKQDIFSWEELRWFGYTIYRDKLSPELPISYRGQSQFNELKAIAKYFDASFVNNNDGTCSMLRKRGPLKHYASYLIEHCQLGTAKGRGAARLPLILKAERLDNIRVFIESLFAGTGIISKDSISLKHRNRSFVYDVQELLLRFGVEFTVVRCDDGWETKNLDYNAYYTFFQEFNIPGLQITGLKSPVLPDYTRPYLKYELIRSISKEYAQHTFGIAVAQDHNYISDNFYVHNTLVLTDIMMYEAVNPDLAFPDTKKSVLVTPNLNQMTPLIQTEFLPPMLSSPFLSHFFIKSNQSQGTIEFKSTESKNYIMFTRIAGTNNESNMVGLHIPNIKGDEMQIFPMPAFIQLRPTYNTWEDRKKQRFAGVPNGVREGSVLYMLDQRASDFKKYRIPALENPYYSQEQHEEDLKLYGGEESQEYQNLVLGEHGEAAFSVMPRDKIQTESTIHFMSKRFNQTDQHAGRDFKDALTLVDIPKKQSRLLIMAADCGFTDPTLIHVLGQDDNGIWRCFARYRLTRITFPDQARIIDWLDNHYNFNYLCFDFGAGGNGVGIAQDLMNSGRFSKARKYNERVWGVRFSDYIDIGYDSKGQPLQAMAKSYAGEELGRLVTNGKLLFSEIDLEGLSQLERIAYNKRPNGTNDYFVMSETGKGKTRDDHIFDSYLVFTLALTQILHVKPKTRLFSGATWV